MRMEEERRHHHHNQNNGSQTFIVGVIIGVALALLFTTKKGRKILRAITDGGLDKIENWEELLYKKVPAVTDFDPIDEMTQAEDYVPNEALQQDTTPSHVSREVVKHALKTEHVDGAPDHKPSSGVRRFFKGAKK